MLSIPELEKFLRQNNCDFEIIEHDKPILRARDAAGYFDIAKTAPVFVADTEGGLIALVVSAGRGRLDFKGLGRSLGYRTFRLADRDRAEAATGYTAGAIPIVGHGLPCLFDSLLLDCDYIYGGTGDALRTLKIAPADAIRLNRVIAVHKF